jgi:iron complex outermembrane receptor protein
MKGYYMKLKFMFILIITLVNFAISDVYLNDTGKTRTYYLNPTVITGTKIEASQSNLPISVSVISAEEIKQINEISILSIVGDRIPGVFVTERGILGYGASQGAAGDISIRGIGGSPTTQVLLLIDGRPQFMGIFGHPFPDNYLTSNAERIEVVRGPASVLYGTNAMGGVINIITKKQKTEGLSSNLNMLYGSYNTFRGTLNLGYKENGYSFFTSYNHDETKGYRDYSDFRMNNGYAKFGSEINENFKFDLDANISKFRTYDPGPASAPLVDNWIEISRRSVGFSLENSFSNIEGGFKAYYNWGINDIYDGWHSTDRNLNFLLYQTLKIFPENQITLGIDYKNYGGEGENKKAGFFSTQYIEGKHFIDEIGFYALAQQFLFSKFIANVGIRLEHNSVFGDELIPQFGLVIHTDKSTTIKASISKGFRSPTIKDLYLFPTRNPDLKPERLWNYEIGMLNNISDVLSLETTLFLSKGSNLILDEGVPPNDILKNSGNFEHKGIEISAKYFAGSTLNFIVSYTYIDPGNETRSNPGHKIFLEAFYRLNSFNFNLGLKQISKLYGDDNNHLRLPDYTILKAKITYKPANIISLFVSGDNLLNKSYQIIYDYPMPGRTFSAGINLNY